MGSSCSPVPCPPPSPSRLLSLLFFLLLLFFFFSSVPWPALSASVVTQLPGFHGRLPFYLETGYVAVDEENGAELFYYFIESEGNPSEDPVLLWLTGGPRCSAFSGLVFEVGPLKFVTAKYNGSLPSLVYFPYSWTKVSNVIFLDSPVGSGFSFSREYEGYDARDMSWSEHVYKFLIQWFTDHPQFLSNPLYVAGDSYAGKIVPIVAQEIIDGIDAGKQPLLNLEGYLIGNPVTGEKVDLNARLPYAHGVGIISDDFFKLTKRNCKGEDFRSPSNSQCAVCLETFDNILSEINKAHILEPRCVRDDIMPRNRTLDRRTLKENPEIIQPPPFPDLRCRSYGNILSYYWANSDLVRQALHIKKGTVSEWRRCKKDLPYTKEIKTSVKYHLSILSRGRYRALVYSGDHDLVVPFMGTLEWIKSLDFPVINDWRSWHVGDQVAGYTVAYSNNLTFATVKGAGHTGPEYRPKECLAMIRRWLSYQPL